MKERVFFIPNRLFWVVLLIGLMLMGAGLVMAQETPLTPGLDAVPTTPSALIAVFTFFAGSVVVSGVVSLLKLIPGNNLNADTLKEWVALAVTAVYLAFVFSGHQDLFGQGADIFDKALPFISGLLGVFQGSSAAHSFSASVGLPLFGYQRTPQRE